MTAYLPPMLRDDLMYRVEYVKNRAREVEENPANQIAEIEKQYWGRSDIGFRAYSEVIDLADFDGWDFEEERIFDFDKIGDIEGELIINHGETLKSSFKGKSIEWINIRKFCHAINDAECGGKHELYRSLFWLGAKIYDAYMVDRRYADNDRIGNLALSYLLSKYIAHLIYCENVICVRKKWDGLIWTPVMGGIIEEELLNFSVHSLSYILPFLRSIDSGDQPYNYQFLIARTAPQSMTMERCDDDEWVPVDPSPSQSLLDHQRGRSGPLLDANRKEESKVKLELERVYADRAGKVATKKDVLNWLKGRFDLSENAAERVHGKAEIPKWKNNPGRPIEKNRFDFNEIK